MPVHCFAHRSPQLRFRHQLVESLQSEIEDACLRLSKVAEQALEVLWARLAVQSIDFFCAVIHGDETPNDKSSATAGQKSASTKEKPRPPLDAMKGLSERGKPAMLAGESNPKPQTHS